MAKIEDEDEAFAEEECTMDFADEPEEKTHQTAKAPAATGSNKFSFPEYPGEDFAKYLEDDDDHQDNAYFNPAPAVNRRPKSTYPEGGYPEENAWELAMAAASVTEEPERYRTKDVIKNRVSQWLNTVKRVKIPGGDSGKYDNQQMYGGGTVARLSDFSYADSKIFSTGDGGPGSDSGIDTRSVRAHSDTGYVEQPQDQPVRSGRYEAGPQSTVRRESGYTPESTSTRMFKSKSSSNISGSSEATTLRSPNGSASPPTSGAGSSKGKKLSKAWKKISNSLSRKPKISNGGTCDTDGQESGLSYNSSGIYEDIRL